MRREVIFRGLEESHVNAMRVLCNLAGAIVTSIRKLDDGYHFSLEAEPEWKVVEQSEVEIKD